MCYTFLILNVRFNIGFITLDHRHSDLRSADNRHAARLYVCFTGFAFYIAVRCGFNKHLYMTSCLNAHNHNTCIRLAQTGCTARKLALFIISQDRQREVLVAIAMATTIKWIKIHDFRDHYHRRNVPLLLLVLILQKI